MRKTYEPRIDGTKLKELRENRKWTQQQLSENSGAGISIISMLESGERSSCRLSTLASIAKALKVDIGTLLI